MQCAMSKPSGTPMVHRAHGCREPGEDVCAPGAGGASIFPGTPQGCWSARVRCQGVAVARASVWGGGARRGGPGARASTCAPSTGAAAGSRPLGLRLVTRTVVVARGGVTGDGRGHLVAPGHSLFCSHPAVEPLGGKRRAVRVGVPCGRRLRAGPASNQALEPTPYSVRSAPAFGRGSPPAFGVFCLTVEGWTC
jgi:hypothetical protein